MSNFNTDSMPVWQKGKSELVKTADQIQLYSEEHFVKYSSLRKGITPQNKFTANIIQMQIEARGNNVLIAQKCT